MPSGHIIFHKEVFFGKVFVLITACQKRYTVSKIAWERPRLLQPITPEDITCSRCQIVAGH